MRTKQIISAVTAVSVAVSSLFVMTATAETTEAQASMYTYTYEKTSHSIDVVQGDGDTVSGLYASSNTNLYLPNVTNGTTTYAELAEMYTGFTVEGFTFEECTVDGLTAEDFEIYTYLMHDNWTWKQENSATMTFADLGLEDTSVIQAMGYILKIKDSSLVDSDIEIGDKIFVNCGEAEYYTYSCGADTHNITIAQGGDDLASGQWAASNKSISLPGISYGTTTFGELKEAYIGVTVKDFVVEKCSIEDLTADDFEFYIYLMHGDSWSWVQTGSAEMIFGDQNIDDSSVIQQIGYVLRIKESTLVNLGLSIGNTVSVNAGSVNAFFYEDILYWDAVDGAEYYNVKVSDGVNTFNDLCYAANSLSIVYWIKAYGAEGTYNVEIYAVDASGNETFIANAEYVLELLTYDDGQNTFTYEINSGDDTVTITGGTINSKDVVIPAVIDGKNVVEIGDSAFSTFSNSTANNIETLVISEGIKKLGWYAFNKCENLKSVTLPQSLEYIDSWAFERCYSLTTINVPANVKTVMGGAFAQNSAMTSITCDAANQNYVSVNGVLFTKDMSALIAYPGGIQGAYTVPASVNHIGDAAFYGARGITSVEILGELDFIGFEAFAECELLTDVKINEGVTYVGYWAFRGCKGIKQLTVPQSVTNIGNQAFGFEYMDNKFTDFSLRGYENSAIHFYAIRHGIPFISIGEVSEENQPFVDEDAIEEEVSTNPDASEEDTITSITVTPAFNLKDKNDMGVGIDLTDVKVKANEIYDGEGLTKAELALGQEIVGNKHYNLLDITLMKGTDDISEKYDGLVKVLIPIPAGHRDKEFYCYRILDDGTKELIPGKREDNNYVIYLEHFSIYAFVADGEHTCNFSEEWTTDSENHWHKCTGCDKTTDMTAHTSDGGKITTDATATTAGEKTYSCTVCGYVIKTETIPATGVIAPVTTPAYTGRPITTTTASTTEETTEATTTTTATTTTAPADEENDTEAEETEDVEEEVEIDENTDTTKPADEDDDSDEDVDADINDYDKDTSDDNPVTGIALGFTGVIISAAAIMLTKKKNA